MAVLSTTLRQEYEAQVKRCFPEANLDHCENEDDFQQVIELHLDKGLCAPGVLTKEKVKSYAEVVRYFYPDNFLEAKIFDIWSIFTQVIYVEAAYRSHNNHSMLRPLEGYSRPILIKGNVDLYPKSISLGVSKSKFIYESFNINTDREGMIRERLSYLLDKKNVPPTFIIEPKENIRKSFQLFIREGTEMNEMQYSLRLKSFPSSHLRELAFSEIIRLNLDPSVWNTLYDEVSERLKFIDGSYTFPKEAVPQGISTLFFDRPWIETLAQPLSVFELSYIEEIDIEESCALLRKHELDEAAVQVHRCALMMLKMISPLNRYDAHRITLEDLLVIINFDIPKEFTHRKNVNHSLTKEGTLFQMITEVKEKSDKEIYQRIFEAFSILSELKSRPEITCGGDVHYHYHKKKGNYFSCD